MGLLDSALGMFGGGQAQMADPKMRLLQAALSMLSNDGQTGGLSGLAGKFQEAGLGDVVNSWIGSGQNMPISSEQIQQALGGGELEQISETAGLSQNETASQLSELLPGLVDKLTPNGQAPQGGFGDVASLLEQFMSKR
ncbi:DUF937 domain-containing protein [Noviherbaspirillum cavernae]|uniref:DUF937 domain-containing protein n=1 Tax=Noviherbaspirillum cavernae TaxID=2320862 RepID=A0A418WZQ6_9BURK|nr:YidB family protein [Noviherbaspirillum cavernae]RJG05563.1 DUF937 domain-containing protein [Noviherbaspirillum cavernae]